MRAVSRQICHRNGKFLASPVHSRPGVSLFVQQRNQDLKLKESIVLIEETAKVISQIIFQGFTDINFQINRSYK